MLKKKKRVIVKSRLLILELWFLFHLTIHSYSTKTSYSVVCSMRAVSEQRIREFICRYGCVEAVDSVMVEAGDFERSSSEISSAILVTLGESLHCSPVQFLHPFSGSRHEDSFRVAGSNLQGTDHKLLSTHEGQLKYQIVII